MEVREALAAWIDKHTTRAEFASAVSISESQLSLIISGKRGVSFETADRISKYTKGKISLLALLSERPAAREPAA